MPAPNWQVSTLPVAGDWRGVEYGGGRWIAWQNSSTVGAYSDDRGVTWQTLTFPASGVTTMKYFGGAWYCLTVYNGTTATLYKSTDRGVTWTIQTLPNRGSTNTNYFWQHLFVVNNRMYLFHNGGSQNAYYTEDGTNWVLFTAPTYGSTMGMAYGNGVYVVHARQTVAYSTDGVTWTYATLPTSQNNNWFTLAFGNGRFVMLNYYDTTSAYSTDGATWTAFTSPRSYFDQMVYGNGTFIASARAEAAYYSDNGTTWAAAAPSTGSSYMSVAYGDGVFIMVPTNGSAQAVRANYNRAPGTPASISFGTPKAGKTLAITCAAVTDPDGDAFNYVWERSVSGGVYSQIGITTVNAFNDTVPTSGTTYNVRVKTVDAHGAESAYRTGSAQAIDYNVPPTISGSDANRGTITAPFSFAYTITDTDAGDALTVVEAVDGREIRRFTATSGGSYTADVSDVWLTLGNGTHTLTITASDQEGASSTRTITFARQTTRIAAARTITLNTRPTKVFLSLFPIPEAGTAAVSVQVCNNPFDASPAWEDISGKQNALVHFFENTTVTNGNGLGYRFIIDPADGQAASFFEAVVRYA